MDYGRLAYDMCEQLTQRLQRLEKTEYKARYKEVILTTFEGMPSKRFNKSFTFEVLNASQLNLAFCVKISGSDGRSQITVKINSIKVKTAYTDRDDYEFTVTANIGAGTCAVDVEILYMLEISLHELTLKVAGEVDYQQISARVSAINLVGKSIISFNRDNGFKLYDYSGSGLVQRCEFNALDAAVAYSNNRVLLAAINDERNLTVMELDENLQADGIEGIVIDSGITQVSAGFDEDLFIIYAVKGSWIYRYEIEQDLTFKKIRLDYSASKVVGSKSVKDAIILVAFGGAVKLVLNLKRATGDDDDELEQRVIKMPKGENYHFENIDGSLTAFYTVNGNVLAREITDGYLQDEKTVALCDEQIMLFDGALLSRIRTELILN